MENEIEHYLNNIKINPKRLKFIDFHKLIIKKKKSELFMYEKRFLYIIQMLIKHREIKEVEIIKEKQTPIFTPLKKIKFDLKMLELI